MGRAVSKELWDVPPDSLVVWKSGRIYVTMPADHPAEQGFLRDVGMRVVSDMSGNTMAAPVDTRVTLIEMDAFDTMGGHMLITWQACVN